MTLRAVRSAQRQSHRPRHIFVVDNGSDDGSVEFIGDGISADADVTLVKLATNGGFGIGCNAAIRLIKSTEYDAIWLLNNDAVADEDCLEHMTYCLKSDNKVGAVGSILYDENKPNADHFGSRLNPISMVSSPLKKAEELAISKYSWVTAASALYSCPALDSVGMFDERFFMYWEDADLAMRLRNGGYMIQANVNARVAHVAGTSSENIPVQRYIWHYRSQKQWIKKHHPLPFFAKIILPLKFVAKSVLDGDFVRMKALLCRLL